ncbi:DUF4489 domain-containing protein [Clostridium estertheticum]|uniref:DUF4489 domain-containing protein n=1 Tax=Clostridium estertheticum TaxID=238834 RepID=UPI001C6F0E18|nr:DUF4489 domain-containing protein [Clostridium estertheticum]MBW9152835.1 DUF4489 domain-containing protein [Clostridium estertheticum]WLC85792.1 DUF4489 domain-containing protein [Clostridium estertheticum]
MNSMSKNNWQDEKGCGCKKEKEKGDIVLLKCKTLSSITVKATDEEKSKKIATLSLNTSHFSDPCIKFDFTTNLIISDVEGGVQGITVNFQLFKLCRGETDPTAIGNQWTFARSDESTDIITFIVCDCDCDCDCVKDDCCTFYVEASYIVDSPGQSNKTATLAFNNPTLSALVVEKNNHC